MRHIHSIHSVQWAQTTVARRASKRFFQNATPSNQYILAGNLATKRRKQGSESTVRACAQPNAPRIHGKKNHRTSHLSEQYMHISTRKLNTPDYFHALKR